MRQTDVAGAAQAKRAADERSRASATPVRMVNGDSQHSRHDKVELYGGGDRHRDQQARQWRTNRIKHFVEKQRRKREWINFAEIADWCSEVEGSVVPNEAARASAYEKLQRDLMEGDFEENNHSRVLYLHPWTVKAKMKRQWMENIIEITPPATIRSQYLDHCWLPRNLFQRWIAKHHLPVLAPRFQPQSRRVPASTAADESAAIKALALHLRRETAPSRAGGPGGGRVDEVVGRRNAKEPQAHRD